MLLLSRPYHHKRQCHVSHFLSTVNMNADYYRLSFFFPVRLLFFKKFPKPFRRSASAVQNFSKAVSRNGPGILQSLPHPFASIRTDTVRNVYVRGHNFFHLLHTLEYPLFPVSKSSLLCSNTSELI